MIRRKIIITQMHEIKEGSGVWITEKKNKRCAKCKTIKPATEYNKKSAANDGLQSYCRACQSGYGAEYRPLQLARRVEIDGHFIVTELPNGALYYKLRPEYIK